MKLNLVIEGVDAAGKTTLIRQLRERYPALPEPTRAATSTEGPYQNMDQWIDADVMLTSIKGVKRLYDRHPLISGPIYERVAGIPQTFPTSGPWFDHQLKQLYSSSLVVVCLPDIETVIENLDAEPQLPGVRENIRDLWLAYYAELDRGAYWYDYEDPRDSTDLRYYLEGLVL